MTSVFIDTAMINENELGVHQVYNNDENDDDVRSLRLGLCWSRCCNYIVNIIVKMIHFFGT